MPALPMFPLGAVLFPHMPLRLRVFEERYLIMMSEVIKEHAGEFGVVLIERGHEVGGGEVRFTTGTTAEIIDLGADSGYVALEARGARRFDVVEWQADKPYPQAEVTDRPELVWERALEPLQTEAEALVRRALAQASEFSENIWPADLELSADPVAAAWQLAGIAPIGELDQIRLLRSVSMEELLSSLIELTADVQRGFFGF